MGCQNTWLFGSGPKTQPSTAVSVKSGWKSRCPRKGLKWALYTQPVKDCSVLMFSRFYGNSYTTNQILGVLKLSFFLDPHRFQLTQSSFFWQFDLFWYIFCSKNLVTHKFFELFLGFLEVFWSFYHILTQNRLKKKPEYSNCNLEMFSPGNCDEGFT